MSLRYRFLEQQMRKMSLKYRLRLWLLDRLLGEPKEISREVEHTYLGIWPKHDNHDEQNKQVIREAIIRARRDGMRVREFGAKS